MNTEKALQENVDKLTDHIKRLEEKFDNQEHEHRKAILETNAKLEFQEKRANQYKQKYQNAIQFKNQQTEMRQIINQLDQKLRNKENLQIQLMRDDQEKKQRIEQLTEKLNISLEKQSQLAAQLAQIKEAALSALMEKENIIQQYSQKIEELTDTESIQNLKLNLIESEQRYKELEDKMEANRIQFVNNMEIKDEEINELQEKFNTIKDKSEERIIKLENQINDYERQIGEILAVKEHDDHLEEKYYLSEERVKKYEKMLNENEANYREEAKKLQFLKQKLHETQKQLNSKKKELQESTQKYQKLISQILKKNLQAENQKKNYSQTIQIKQQEIQRLKLIIKTQQIISSSKKQQIESSQSIQAQFSPASSPKKTASIKDNQEISTQVQRLKKQNKQLENNNALIKRRFQQQTKELQDLRQRVLSASGSNKSVQEAGYLRQIQQLNSYLKKVECDMLLKKQSHAQDQNFWNIKQKKYKLQIENLIKDFKKQKSQLLDRIEKLKKTAGKDKKDLSDLTICKDNKKHQCS